MSQRKVISLAIVLTALIATGLAVFVPIMAPIRLSTPMEFWKATCGISRESTRFEGYGGLPVVLQDGWLIFQLHHLHGSTLFKAKENEVAAELSWACRELETGIVKKKPASCISLGYLAWKKAEEKERRGVIGLMDRIETAFCEKSPEKNGYRALDQYDFNRRIRQAKWYWANIGFEFIFLSGLVWFVAWPATRHKPPWQVALHLGLIPILFMFPVYLGYSTYTFTSRGPSGGVLYPWLLVFCRGGFMNDLDKEMIEYLPQILEPLSQGIGNPMVLSGTGMPGPITTLKVGICLAILAYVILWLNGFRKKKSLGQSTPGMDLSPKVSEKPL
jgi:hypothetical protein